MLADEIRRAIPATPKARLCDLSAALWKAYGAGLVAEADAQALAEAIEARKAIPAVPLSVTRRVGSRPRSSTSMERRRAWTASGWLPPAIAARFTMGEAAALAVIVREIATAGRCGLPVGAIAGRAGVCATTVRNAVREARSSGLLHVEQRRVAYARSLPNVVTIASRELALWVRTRARVERQGGGCRTAAPTTNHLPPTPARPSAETRERGSRGRKTPPSWPTDRVRHHLEHRVR